MCYQAFIHFACGHSEIVDTTCEQGQGITFWVKHACAKYQYESKYPNADCGRGKYYCGKDGMDGPWLNVVHEALEKCQAEVKQVDDKLAVLKLQAQSFTMAADERNIPEAARKVHPAHITITNMHTLFLQQRAGSEAGRVKATHIIQEAVRFFARRRLRAQQGITGIEPAFVLPANIQGRVPMELGPLEPLQLAAPSSTNARPNMAVTQQAIDVSQNGQLTHQALPRLPPSEGDNIHVTHVRRDSVDPSGIKRVTSASQDPQKPPPPGSLTALKLKADRRVIEQDASAGNPRRRKTVPQKQPPALLADDESTIRRSTRVRKKKVSYAESQGSDISHDNSNANSPDKYEASPEKPTSESSGSPEPQPRRGVKQQDRKPQRGPSGRRINGSKCDTGETLASKIGDWRRRAGTVAGDTSGKSTPLAGMAAVGGQAAAQQRGQQNIGTRRASSNLWQAPPSAHAQILMNGGDPFTTASAGMYGFGNGNSAPPSQFANAMNSNLGRPFLDNTKLPAAVGPNIFNSYMQQSWPGVNSRPAPSQSWAVQQGAQRPMQQITSMQPPQANMMYGSNQPQFDFQSASGAGNFATPQATPTQAPSHLQYSQMQNAHASGTAMQQAAFPSAAELLNGGYTQGMTPGLQTPAGSTQAESVSQGGDLNPLPDIDVTQYFDYDNMRRSFGATHDLSPAKTPEIIVTDTEPKKRALPASSPTPAAKRMRLSLPGPEDASGLYQRRLAHGAETARMMATSSPAKMSTQQDQMTECSTQFEGIVHDLPPPSAPAPIMAPTAIHFPQASTTTLAENLEDAAELPGIGGVRDAQGMSSEATGGDQDIDGGMGSIQDGNYSSEIDWGMDDWVNFGNE